MDCVLIDGWNRVHVFRARFAGAMCGQPCLPIDRIPVIGWPGCGVLVVDIYQGLYLPQHLCSIPMLYPDLSSLCRSKEKQGWTLWSIVNPVQFPPYRQGLAPWHVPPNAQAV